MYTILPKVIRFARPEDRSAMAALHKASIRSCLGAYTEEQVAAWTAAIRPEAYDQALADKVVLVAEDLRPESRHALLGLGILDVDRETRTGDIRALYVAPGAQCRFVGSQLLECLALEARSQGAERLTVHATLNSRDFYEGCGFRKVADAEHRLPGGAVLPCLLMTDDWTWAQSGGNRSRAS